MNSFKFINDNESAVEANYIKHIQVQSNIHLLTRILLCQDNTQLLYNIYTVKPV